MDEVELNIETDIIVAKSRKLKATWSLEPQEDLRSWFGDYEESRLAQILAEDMFNDIVRYSGLDHNEKIDWKQHGF